MNFAMYIWVIVTYVALPLFLVGAVVLAIRRSTFATRSLGVSLAVACIGQIVQVMAPFKDTASYVKNAEGEVISASFEFPTAWYVGSLLISAGIVAAIVSFLWFAFTDRKLVGSRQSNSTAQSDARDEAARAAGRER
jgi:hypothetical protein